MVQIIPYHSTHFDTFKSLNYAWITQLFEVEDSDRKILNDPDGEIISKGGHVFIALLDEKPVGTCSLINKGDNVYELAKMAVSEEARGKKIGWLLGSKIIEKAKELGAKTLVLETNSKLIPAINLYKKLGFSSLCGDDSSAYQRCDIQMEMKF